MIISDLLGNVIEVHSAKFGDSVCVQIVVEPDQPNADIRTDLTPAFTFFFSAATARKLSRLLDDKAKQADAGTTDPR